MYLPGSTAGEKEQLWRKVQRIVASIAYAMLDWYSASATVAATPFPTMVASNSERAPSYLGSLYLLVRSYVIPSAVFFTLMTSRLPDWANTWWKICRRTSCGRQESTVIPTRRKIIANRLSRSCTLVQRG